MSEITEISMDNDFQTPQKVMTSGGDGNLDTPQNNSSDQTAEMKPTPAIVKRKKFKDLFQSPSDSLLSPMSRNLNGKTHPALLKQKPKPKRLNNLKAEAEIMNANAMEKGE